MNEGQRKLRGKGTQKEIARRVGHSQQAVSRWLHPSCPALPDLPGRRAIQRAYPEIEIDDWDKAAMKRQA